MTQYNRNSRKLWTAGEVKQIRQLVKQNTPTRVIGLKLGRTEGAVYVKPSQEGISLRPANQPPYGKKAR